MKLATLACLAALCLIGQSARAAPAEAVQAGAPAPPAAAEPAAAPGQTAPRAETSARAERRRRSYAACNRASHQRALRGGKRRRFMTRCRLGYERTRGQQIQAPAPVVPVPEAPPPGRQP